MIECYDKINERFKRVYSRGMPPWGCDIYRVEWFEVMGQAENNMVKSLEEGEGTWPIWAAKKN